MSTARHLYSVLAVAARPQLILASALLLAGCGSPLLPPPDQRPNHTYLLQWHGGAQPPVSPPRRDSLLVSPMLSAPGFDSSDMAYIRTAHEIEYFAHHRWVDAPARMLEPLLVRAAEQSGVFHNVVESSGTGIEADLRLDSKLIHLQQVRQSGPSGLQLAVRVTLTDVASASVIASRTLSVTEPIHIQTPYAGVEAANRAVAQLLTQVQSFLVDQVR